MPTTPADRTAQFFLIIMPQLAILAGLWRRRSPQPLGNGSILLPIRVTNHLRWRYSPEENRSRCSVFRHERAVERRSPWGLTD
ncbi:hypothetical protein [Oxynema aestuarii]|uniref:Uncharacterized protein n=1 Tax=Oxynema aestuarii AP17 TaxID=2064643 RepID=A0A6H1TYR6_9CYAN|nr:hypothetical protein [Oxynema aestuarii]QIZ71758.1 hypothetical protein HCG48_15150 [Oxynema aestuarii AP17]